MADKIIKIQTCLLAVLLLCIFGLSFNVTAAYAEDIQSQGSYSTGVTWALYTNGNLVLGGNGKVPNDAFNNYSTEETSSMGDKVTSVEFGKGITEIGAGAFSGCTNLRTASFEEGSSLNSIGDSAFDSTSNFTITLPSKTITIGSSAFGHSTGVTVNNIQPGTTISSYAFMGGSNLQYCISDYYLSDDSSNYIVNTGEGLSVEYSDGALAIDLKNSSHQSPCNKEGVRLVLSGKSVELSSVKSISYKGVNVIQPLECTNVETVSIGAEATSISVGAFDGCSKLASVTFAENCQLTTVGSAAFRGCSALTSIDFTKCTKLTCIGSADDTMGDGNSPFQSCTSLASVVFPSSLERLGGYALNGCSALETVDLSGTKLTSIGASAFQSCRKLKTVLVPATLKTLSLSQRGFDNNNDCEIVVCGASKAPECLGGSSDLQSTITWSSTKTSTVTVPQVLVDQVSAVSVTKDNYTEAATKLDSIQASYDALSDAAKSVIKADFETAMAAKRAQQVFLSAGTTNLKYGDTFTVNVDEATLTAAMSATFTESTNLKLVKIEKSDALSGTNLSFNATLEGENAGLFSFFGNEAAGSGTVVTATFECVGTGDATVGMGDVTVGKSGDVNEYDIADPDPLKLYIALKGAKGDLNGDGFVNIVDAQIAFDLATGKFDEGSPYEAIIACWAEQKADLSTIKTFADVNGDGELDAVDARAIQYAIHNGGFAA